MPETGNRRQRGDRPWMVAMLAFLLATGACLAGAPDLTLKAWPLLYYAPDEVTKETRFEFLWPLYVRQITPDYTADQLLSFPQTFPVDYNRQFYLGWPLTGLRLAPEGHDAWLFPLLWSGSGEDRRHFVLFPALFYLRHLNGGNLNLALLQHNHWTPHEQAHYLFPLAWTRWSSLPDEISYSHALLPLFRVTRDYTERTTTDKAGVAQHSVSDDRDSWLLLAGWGRDHAETRPANTTRSDDYTALLPLYYHNYGRSDDHARRETGEFQRLWLLPWYHSTSLKTHLQRPAADDTAATGVTEGTEEQGQSRNVLFPLFWERQEFVSGAKPSTRHSQILLPLCAWMNAVAPEKHEYAFGLVPYWRHTVRTPADTAAAKPASLTLAQGLFPLYWDFYAQPPGGPEERSTYLLPLGARLYKEGEYSTQNLLGPLFTRCDNRLDKSTRYDVLFPLLKLQLGPTVTGWRLFPLAGGESRQHRYANWWFLFPFGWDYEVQPNTPAGAGLLPERWRPDQLESRRAPMDDTGHGAALTQAFIPFCWHRREDGRVRDGVMPLFARDHVNRPPTDVATDWYWPLLLGRTETRQAPAATWRQDYLLSALAWGGGENFELTRVFPLYSFTREGNSRRAWSLALPFNYESTERELAPDGRERHTTVAIPFSWLPWFKSEGDRRTPGQPVGAPPTTVRRSTRFFPFFNRKRDVLTDQSSLSVLWPLFNAEWNAGETKVEGLGGVTNYYERDANGFTERRFLYRLYRSRSRSWLGEQELMPFFSRTVRGNGEQNWSVLGGMLGAGRDADSAWMRLFFIPFRRSTPAATPAVDRTTPAQHAEYALHYVKAGRHDRAVIEFLLAGEARADNAAFQLAAGQACLRADPDRMETDLRESLPPSMSSWSAKGQGYDPGGTRQKFRALALEHFNRALQLGANPRLVKRHMAHCQYDLGDTEACLKLLQEIYRQHGGGLDAGLDYTAALLKAGGPERNAAAALVGEIRQLFPSSPTVLLLSAATQPVAVDDTTRAALYEQAAMADSSPEEQAWLVDVTAATAGRADTAWLAPGLYGTGIGHYETSRPQIAAVLQAMQVLSQQTLAALEKPETRSQAAALAARRLGLMARRATLEKGSSEVRRWYESELRTLDEQFTGRHAVAELLTAYNGTPATAPAAFRATVTKHTRRLEFDRSYLTAWQVCLTVPGTAPAPTSKTVQLTEGTAPYIDLDRLFGGVDHCTSTADCVIQSPDERPVRLWLGFDHELTAELNGVTVFGPRSSRIASRDEFSVAVKLKPGENRLRLTLSNDRLSYGFYARLADPDGQYMPGVTVKLP